MFLPHRVAEARNAHLGREHPDFLSQETVADRMTEILRRRDPARWADKKIRGRQILRWEGGQNEPRTLFVEVLAEATGAPFESFFGEGNGGTALHGKARELIAPFQRRDGRRAFGRVPGARRRKAG